MKKITSLVTGHKDIVGAPISIGDWVITGNGAKSIIKRIVCGVTPKGVRVCEPEDLIRDRGWGGLGYLRSTSDIYVIGPFIPPDVHFIQSINNVDIRLLMLEAWELRNNMGVV